MENMNGNILSRCTNNCVQRVFEKNFYLIMIFSII